jgi:hypothetical protein
MYVTEGWLCSELRIIGEISDQKRASKNSAAFLILLPFIFLLHKQNYIVL